MTHPTFTTTAKGLRGLLAPVIPFADKGDSLPVLQAILLRGHGDYVTALATDRYRLGIQRAKVTAPETLHAIVPLTTVRQVLAIFKASRSHDPELTLTFEPHKVTVDTTGGMDLLDARISFPLLDAEYPKALKTIREAAAVTATEPVGEIGFNPTFLADFRHVATSAEPMVMRIVGANRAAIVSIGEDFRGVIMPTRRADEHAMTTGLDGSWAALVAEAAPVEAVAS